MWPPEKVTLSPYHQQRIHLFIIENNSAADATDINCSSLHLLVNISAPTFAAGLVSTLQMTELAFFKADFTETH